MELNVSFNFTVKFNSYIYIYIYIYMSLPQHQTGYLPHPGRAWTPIQEPANLLVLSISVFFKPPGRGPVPRPGINYTGPREVLLEFVILVF